MKKFNLWKRLLSTLLVVALMCPIINTTASAASLGDAELAGIKMTPAEFEDAYVTNRLQCVAPEDYEMVTTY